LKTGRYDAVLECNEKIANKLVCAAVCMGNFQKMSGSYVLPIPNVQPSLIPFVTIGYEAYFNVPMIDFISENIVKMSFSSNAVITVLDGINVAFGLAFSIEIAPAYNAVNRQFTIDFKKATITQVKISGISLHQNVLNKLCEIMSIVFKEYLENKVSPVTITPVLYSLQLPNTTKDITINLGGTRITDSIIMAGFDFLSYTGGDVSRVTDFTCGNDFSIGLSENGVRRVFDFWWVNTTYPKTFQKNYSWSFDTSEYDDWLDWLLTAFALATGGAGWIFWAIVNLVVDVNEVSAEYGYKIDIGKPALDLLDGNKIQVSGEMDVDLWAKLYLKIAVHYPWETKKYKKKIGSYTNNDVKIRYSAEGKVYLDGGNRLVGDIVDFDIEVSGLLPDAPEFLLNRILNAIIDEMIESYPLIVISSAIIEKGIPGTKLTLNVKVKTLEVNTEEAILSANLHIKGMENYCKPPYIANKNPRSLEVHASNCTRLKRVLEHHKVPYFFLDDALEDGYDGCYYCLRQLSRR